MQEAGSESCQRATTSVSAILKNQCMKVDVPIHAIMLKLFVCLKIEDIHLPYADKYENDPESSSMP